MKSGSGKRRLPGVAGGALVLLLLTTCWLGRRRGADFERYQDWMTAASTGNIFALSEDVASPMGVPFFHWSAGPGLIFALGWGAMGRILPETQGALLVGWLWAALGSIFLVGLLREYLGTERGVLLFGGGILFFSSHAGYLAHVYSSESLCFTCFGLLIYVIARDQPPGWAEVGAAIAAACLVLVFRVQTLPLVLVALAALSWRLWKDRDVGRRWWYALVGMVVAVGVAGFQNGIVNRWMTGSAFKSPYDFHSGQFKELDFLHPKLWQVLFHPWHGLFAYHPLVFGGVLAALAITLSKGSGKEQRVLWAGALVALGALVWALAAIYSWWQGLGTFGMRGLAAVTPFLVLPVARTLATKDAEGIKPRLLWAAVLAATLWSAALLWQGDTQFYSIRQLLAGQAKALAGSGLASSVVIASLWGFVEFAAGVQRRGPLRLVTSVGVALTSLGLAYLVHNCASGPGPILRGLGQPIGEGIAAFSGGLLAHIFVRDGPLEARLLGRLCAAGGITMIVVLVGMLGLFTRLAWKTEEMIRHPDPGVGKRFRYEGTMVRSDWEAVYREYLMVPGYEEEKARLRQVLVSTFGPDSVRTAR